MNSFEQYISGFSVCIRGIYLDDSFTFEATVKELPDITEYADTYEEAYLLAMDTIKTTYEMFSDQNRTMPSYCDDHLPLDERMQNAGMIPLSKILEGTSMAKWGLHCGVDDLDTFLELLEMKHEEYLRGQIRRELDKKEDDDMYEWYLAHSSVYGTIKEQFKHVMNKINEVRNER